jgi:hypothetical protein
MVDGNEMKDNNDQINIEKKRLSTNPDSVSKKTKFSIPMEITQDQVIDSQANKKENISLKKEQTKHLRKENQLSNSNKELEIKIARLEIKNEHFKHEKRRILIMNAFSSICIGIGSGMVANSLSNNFGWILIIIGCFIYGLSIF